MEEMMTFVTEEGTSFQAMVMGNLEDDLSGKNYVIYTDASRDENGNYNIYIASYDPEQEDDPILIHAVETAEEWQHIELMLEKEAELRSGGI